MFNVIFQKSINNLDGGIIFYIYTSLCNIYDLQNVYNINVVMNMYMIWFMYSHMLNWNYVMPNYYIGWRVQCESLNYRKFCINRLFG